MLHLPLASQEQIFFPPSSILTAFGGVLLFRNTGQSIWINGLAPSLQKDPAAVQRSQNPTDQKTRGIRFFGSDSRSLESPLCKICAQRAAMTADCHTPSSHLLSYITIIPSHPIPSRPVQGGPKVPGVLQALSTKTGVTSLPSFLYHKHVFLRIPDSAESICVE